MMTNPTDPKHVRELLSIQRDLIDVQKNMHTALVMATDPELILNKADVRAALSRARFVADRLAKLEGEVEE